MEGRGGAFRACGLHRRRDGSRLGRSGSAHRWRSGLPSAGRVRPFRSGARMPRAARACSRRRSAASSARSIRPNERSARAPSRARGCGLSARIDAPRCAAWAVAALVAFVTVSSRWLRSGAFVVRSCNVSGVSNSCRRRASDVAPFENDVGLVRPIPLERHGCAAEWGELAARSDRRPAIEAGCAACVNEFCVRADGERVPCLGRVFDWFDVASSEVVVLVHA